MKILLISPLPLFPNSTGATERILNIIYFLSKKGHELTIALPYIYTDTEADYIKLKTHGKIRIFRLLSSVIPPPSGEESSKSFLKRIRDLVPFNLTIFSPAKLAQLYVEEKTNHPQIILAEFDGSWLVGYILSMLLKSHLIIDKHNVESVLFYRIMKQEKSKLDLLDKFRLYVVLMLEMLVWKKADGIIVVSKRDYTISQRLFGHKNHLVIAPNGIETGKTIYSPNEAETRKWLKIPINARIIVFHGLGTYPPNVDARERIIHSILPLTKELSKEDIYAVIVGPGNAPRNRVLSHNKIRLVGEVSKEQLYQILSCSDVAVVPLKSGSGTRLKILDYFNIGIPVVATALAAEGLYAEDGKNILIRQDDKEFAEAVTKILSENSLRENLSQNAKLLVKDKFDWNTVLNPIEDFAWSLNFNVGDATVENENNSHTLTANDSM
jgi:polysaccharide biosynthesis protein PslH